MGLGLLGATYLRPVPSGRAGRRPAGETDKSGPITRFQTNLERKYCRGGVLPSAKPGLGKKRFYFWLAPYIF
ncbi:hypothetical protein NY78_3659 [Desulfovibrio sp. TomC]|nr:hypothetical protein NY78_3659 [Desulfovibrio sp. TomC]